ncbi:MAG TPA: hypothetical protein VKZ50_06020 [bacterium]|nr:hypothetical protein [bacterium]
MVSSAGPNKSRIIARIGTALVLGFFGYWELTTPGEWTGYVPHFVEPFVSSVSLVLLHGWILFMLATAALVDFLPSVISWITVAMMTEVVVGLLLTRGDTSVLIRDVGVLALALVWTLECQPLIVRNEGLEKEGPHRVVPNRL